MVVDIMTDEQLEQISEVLQKAVNSDHERVMVDVDIAVALLNELKTRRATNAGMEANAGIMLDMSGSSDGESVFGVSKDLTYTFKLSLKGPSDEITLANLQQARDCALDHWGATLDRDIQQLVDEVEAVKNGKGLYSLN